MHLEMKQAIFLQESKFRFMCTIQIDGEYKLCHIPCSAKLSNYIDLDNNNVLVIKNLSSHTKTEYKLIAIQDHNDWILVNFSMVNLLIKEHLSSIYDIELEKKISDTYKADLICKPTKVEFKPLIIEGKGIISKTSTALVPNLSGERALRQLDFFLKALKSKTYSVEYCFVLMNNGIDTLKLNRSNKEFRKLFKKCLRAGMLTSVYQVHIDNCDIYLEPKEQMSLNS